MNFNDENINIPESMYHDTITRFRELTRRPAEGDLWSGVGITFLPQEPLTDEELAEITEIMNELPPDTESYERCSCGCNMRFSIWDSIASPFIRFGALNYILNTLNYDDQIIVMKILGVLKKLFGVTGTVPDNSRHLEIVFEHLSREIPLQLLDYRDPLYGCSMAECVTHGFSDVQITLYLNKILDLHLLHRPNERFRCLNKLEDRDEQSYERGTLDLARSNGYPTSLVGNNLINILMTRGDSESIRRFLDNVSDDELNTMNAEYIYRPNNLILEPILCETIRILARRKSHELMLNVARCIRLFLDRGYDIGQSTINSQGNSHNITDYLNYYGFIYEGSPIYNVLSNILPEPLDPELECFLAHVPMRNHINRTNTPEELAAEAYETIKLSYYYVKDPDLFQEFMDDVRAVYQQHQIPPDLGIFAEWRFSTDEVINFFRSIGLEMII